MTTEYRLNIHFSAETANALVSGNFSLLALQSSQSTIDGGQPVLWLKSHFTDPAAAELVIQVSDESGAYVSASPIISGRVISPAAQSMLRYGQVMRIQADGRVAISYDGPAGGLSILNESTIPWSCGLTNPSKAIAAVPLYGLMMNTFAPVPRLLVAITSYPGYVEQSVLESIEADGFLADFKGVTDRDVTFDINKGWGWGGWSWGQILPARTPLAPALIEWSVAPASSPAPSP
jgi:hypothetical protein